MKTIIKSLLLSLVLFAVISFFENNKTTYANVNNKAACPITINFCISGAGAGVQMEIFLSNNCTGTVVTTLTTGSNGCAQYTFDSNCDSTHTIRPICPSLPGGCQYFSPDNWSGGDFPVTPCP